MLSLLNKKSAYQSAVILGLGAFLSACGAAPPGGIAGAGVGMGSYTIPGMPQGCMPINGVIGFTAQNIGYNNIARSITAGTPPQQAVFLGRTKAFTQGTVSVGPGAMNVSMFNTRPDAPAGRMSLNITTTGQTGQYVPSTTGNYYSGTGAIQLSPTLIQAVMNQSGAIQGFFPMFTGAPTAAMNTYCVVSVAFDLDYYSSNVPSQDILNNGRAWLTTTMGPIELQF